MKLRIILEENIFFDKENRTCIVKNLPARIKLVADRDGYLPKGWCLIKGALKRRGKNLKAKLIINDEKYVFPVNCKGTMLELIKIPSKTKEIIFEPMNSIGEFEIIEDFTLKPVRNIERIYRMLKRVLFFFQKRFKHKRKILGLSYYTPFFNLKRAYELANKIRDCDSTLDYSKWTESFDRLTDEDTKRIKKDIKKSNLDVVFNILIHNQDEEELEKTIQSLEDQIYKSFTVNILKNRMDMQFNEFLTQGNTKKTYFLFLKSGTVLSSHALYRIAKEARISNADLIYTDHDYITAENERVNPCFKPDFSLEYLRATNYIDSTFAVKAEVLSKIEGLDMAEISWNLHSLLLKIAEKTSKIKHIPAVLFHLPLISITNNDLSSDYNPVREHLERMQVSATVEKIDFKNYKVIYHVKNNLLISIIIPTKNQLAILKKCIESIIRKTTYDNYEILLVDNQSNDLEAIEYLKSLTNNAKIRVFRYDKSYNFSAINNFAVSKAQGEVLLFLNNDTEVITSQWLEIMLGCLQQPNVGAVGAKLYYPNGKIQHAGVVIGTGGCADHAFKCLNKEENGYMDRTILQQEYSAVTAACMMTWKNLFIKIGGFDEVNLPVSFNDVDYCLKLREAGYRIVFTPYVELYHYESLSRGKDLSPESQKRAKREADFIRKKWQKYIEYDPFYNPNLNYNKPDFNLNSFPKIKKPWNKNGF